MSEDKQSDFLSKEELRKLQLKSLDLLIYFKKICDENNLLFYFCGGCCIEIKDSFLGMTTLMCLCQEMTMKNYVIFGKNTLIPMNTLA